MASVPPGCAIPVAVRGGRVLAPPRASDFGLTYRRVQGTLELYKLGTAGPSAEGKDAREHYQRVRQG